MKNGFVSVPGLVASVLVFTCVWSPAALVINEVCYDNDSLADETGDTSSDWIELYNPGPVSVNVRNFALGDANPFEVGQGVVLPNYTIPPGGFLVVFANADLPQYTAWKNAPNSEVIPANAAWKYTSPASAPASTWKSSSFNDAAWASGIAPLGYNDATLNLDTATVMGYGGNPTNRYPTAYFRNTFRLVNPAVVTNLLVLARINDGMVVYLNGSEVLRQNMPGGAIGHTTLALSGVSATLWTTNLLPATGLVAGANVLAVEVHQASLSSVELVMDLTVTALVNELVPVVHGQFGLSKDGENIHLFDPTLTRIHRFPSPGFGLGEDRSYGLVPDGATNAMKVYERASPGLPNATYPQKYAEVLTSQKPVFSLPPGVYAGNRNVTLLTPIAGYKVYYTLDGTDPRNSSTFLYSGNAVTVTAAAPASSGLSWMRTIPVELDRNVPEAAWRLPVGSVAKAVVLRAIAVSADNLYCSPETCGTYFIGPQFTNRTLPIISLTTDADNLFGFARGIYVPGKYYADSVEGYGPNQWGKPHANYHQVSQQSEWERPLQFELFEANQTTAALSQRLGVTIYGGGTRALPQKSLYFLARLGEYGVDRVNYALFPAEPATSYKRFLLRNSGNDWYGLESGGVATMLKDAVFHRMLKGLDTALMAYRPAVVYLNGEYWGLHDLRESLDKHYLADHYGLEPENCDILMNDEDPLDNSKVKIAHVDGDTNADEEYEAMIDWIQLHPLAQSANYAQIQTWVDVANFADYIIAETFFANTDWPINNCDFWRAHTNQVATCGKYGDGRWRWMLYDLDAAGSAGAFFNMFTYLTSSQMTGGNEPGFLISQLWQNAEFRTYFVTRYANLLNTTFRPERLAGIASQAASVIAPEIETHFRRWGRIYTRSQWEQAVTNVVIQYTATRHDVSWDHLDRHFGLGGTGVPTLRNQDPGGTGGRMSVNGVVLDLTTHGVTNRALWTGRFFRSLPVQVLAVPDAGYVFDGWAGTALTNATVSVLVGATPVMLTARFRPASAPAHVPTGYERWQLANYSELEILSGMAAAPNAPSGCAGMSNFELYAFGMHRQDGLTDSERFARVSLSIFARSNALWVGYNRLNGSFTDVRHTLKVASSLESPMAWTNAVVGLDLDPVALTNVLDASTWFYQIRLPAASPGRELRFFKLEAALDPDN